PTTPPEPALPHTDGFAARRAATSQQILQAAAQVMADRGYAGTSLDAVAELAGVAKGSIYNNFGSKERLFEALIAHTMDRFSATLAAAPGGHTGAAALEGVVAALLVEVRDNPAGTQLLAAELFRMGRTWQESLEPVRERIVSVFREVIAQTNPAADVSVVGPAVFGATLIAGLEWRTFQPERTLPDITEVVMGSVRSVLGPAG
ncbi:TetR/AcrR family transcriptional regulator, partial [Actinotalea sp. C106]|uniref:TetR/AcrR family transcriptional regulator n=1 Tax=Actinotalea sp. C106 TaxID=2908644 RepID=UPI0020291CD6